MDIGTAIGIIALSVSVIGTALTLLYTRRRTKIMEEQLRILRKESTRKTDFEVASDNIRQVIRNIKEYSTTDYFFFPPLMFSRDNILAFLHDNQPKDLKLHIKPKDLKIFDSKGHRKSIETVANLKETILSWLDMKVRFSGGVFFFTCTPDILENPDVDLGDAFSAIRAFYEAHRMLKSYEKAIDAFDNKILDDLEQTIGVILETMFKSLMVDHTIVFSLTDKSDEVLRKLQNEIVGLDSVEKLLNKLTTDICDRLSIIQKEMFLKS